MNHIYKNLCTQFVEKASFQYEDGEMGVERCVEKYCRVNEVSQDFGNEALRVYLIEKAVECGIPRDVAEGKAKLTDYFSKEYIQSNK